jgi:DNA-binding protein YbaB
LNGEHKITNININDSLLSDKEMLEDLIMIAVNDASSKVNNILKEKMKNVTGGLNLPF